MIGHYGLTQFLTPLHIVNPDDAEIVTSMR